MPSGWRAYKLSRSLSIHWSEVNYVSTHSAHLDVSIQSGLAAQRCTGVGNINDCGEGNHHAELLAAVRQVPRQPLAECVFGFELQRRRLPCRSGSSSHRGGLCIYMCVDGQGGRHTLIHTQTWKTLCAFPPVSVISSPSLHPSLAGDTSSISDSCHLAV